MTTADAKLAEFRRAFKDADDHYASDILTAGGNGTLVQKIEATWWKQHANWAQAATAALERNSPAIDDAYKAAKDANDTVERARDSAASISKIVTSVGNAADSLSKLLKAIASL